VSIRQLTVEDLRERLDQRLPTYLLDVREPWEHDLAHLPGDVLVPLHELEERAGEIEPEPGALLVCYCHHGVRSLHAAAYLQGLGRAEVCSLAGGIDAWSVQVDATVRRY
jgi:rhodanese-related sulfurtransferase